MEVSYLATRAYTWHTCRCPNTSIGEIYSQSFPFDFWTPLKHAPKTHFRFNSRLSIWTSGCWKVKIWGWLSCCLQNICNNPLLRPLCTVHQSLWGSEMRAGQTSNNTQKDEWGIYSSHQGDIHLLTLRAINTYMGVLKILAKIVSFALLKNNIKWITKCGVLKIRLQAGIKSKIYHESELLEILVGLRSWRKDYAMHTDWLSLFIDPLGECERATHLKRSSVSSQKLCRVFSSGSRLY